MHSPFRVSALLVVAAVVISFAGAPAAGVVAATGPSPGNDGGVEAGPAPASADGTHGELVEGTVTDAEGQPVEGAYVLVQARGEGLLQNATAGDEPIRQSLLELADEHPFGLYWNETTESGSYTVHVPSPANYEVIAVTDEGVSRLRTVSVKVGAAEQDLTVDPDRILSLETSDPSATPGEIATVELRVPNPGDEPVEDLTVALSPPAGWSIEGVETDGTWDADARTLTFERIEPGEAATATVRVRVPPDAERGVHRIGVAADARQHFVEHLGSVQVRVAESGEDTPTLTSTPTERRFTISDPAPPDRSPSTWPYLLSAGAFAVGAAFAGYSVWRTAGLR